MTKVASDFPAAPKVAEVAADIVASADPTCSATELAELKEEESALDEAIEVVEDALEDALESIEGKHPFPILSMQWLCNGM